MPASHRKAGVTVLERYRVDEFSNSVVSLLRGESAYVAAYDPKTREFAGDLLRFKPPNSPFIFVVEGFTVLALEKLRKNFRLEVIY